MGFLSHRVTRSNLEVGDHIYTWRTAFIYSHHGIYIGGEKVVHFTQHQMLSSSDNSTSTLFSSSATNVLPTCDVPDCGFKNGESGVTMSCLNCFMRNGSLYRFEYGVSPRVLIAKFRGGVCTTAQSDPPEQVIHRAMYLLHNGFGNYDSFANNCEDFALYCKTGLLVSSQEHNGFGSSGQASSAVGVPASAIFSLPLRLFFKSPLVYGAGTAVNYAFHRYATDIGVRRDTVKVEVEDIAAPQGSRSRKRRRHN